MEIRLRHGARTLAVRLEEIGDEIAATLDDAAHRIGRLAVGARTTGPGGAAVHEVTLEIDGRGHRALVARTRDRVLVSLGGRVHAFETGDASRDASSHGTRSGRVTAPMPGKIVTVLVAVGDVVEVGTPLVVMEAMKMESTLTAEVGGRVTQVAAVPGTVVDGDALLVEIAADAGG